MARGDEWQTGQVQRELAGLSDDAARQGGELELRLPDVRALMSERLAGQPTRANFRTGTLTVCTMVPMRSVPHRVVCLLGLDDGVFPRAPAIDGDDVLARTPLTGERDLRSEDRQLMLDAILAAREQLVVTYSGANETTGQLRPPAVPLGELLDALDDTVDGGRDHALERHPLQAFDPKNLRPPCAVLLRQGSTGRRAGSRGTRVPVPSLAGEPLPPRDTADIELGSLVAFFRHPVRAFLRDRLGVSLLDEGDDVADGLPVELDNLQQWAVGDRLLRDQLRGRTPDRALGTEWRRGVLPPGRLGWRLGQRLTKAASPVAEMVESVTQGQEPRAVDVDVDLGGGRRLRGTVTGLYGERIVIATFSRLGPRQWLEAWIPLLALCATHPGRHWSAGAIGKGEKGRYGAPDTEVARVAFASVDGATELLRDLVAMYDAGQCEPLPLPLQDRPRLGRAPPAGQRHGRPQGRRVQVADEQVLRRERRRRPRRGLGGRCAARGAARSAPPRRGVRRRDHPPRRAVHAAVATDAGAGQPMTSDPAPFDVLGPLPEGRSTTVLEASAGTGKTFTVGALVARYVAEGIATLDEMLVITFGRAASQELRERVREQLVAAERALSDPSTVTPERRTAQPSGQRRRRPAPQADHRRAGRLRRRHDRHHPPVLPAGAALAGCCW